MNARTARNVAIGLVMVTLAVLVVVFGVQGILKNRHIDELHHNGVETTFTVTKCFGLLGGTGSNPVGYSCRGTFTVGGHRYDEPLPGIAYHAPGSTLRVLAVPNNPALVTPVGMAATERTSWTVFVLPAALLVALVLLVLVLLLVRRRTGGGRRRAASGQVGGV